MELQPTSFLPREVEAVLDAYDLGNVSAVKKFRAGSPYSPKAIIETDRGEFLLKRRAPGRDEPLKVAFAHELQVYLRDRQFPLPHLQGTRAGNNTILQLHGAVYEVFEYLPAAPYDRSPTAAHDAGRVLALYHKLLERYKAAFQPPSGCIHDNADVQRILESRLKVIKQGGDDGIPVSYLDELRATFGALRVAYNEACQQANRLGLPGWPPQITHSDWHPSNVLFIDQLVVGVIDFDSARIQVRAVDVANAAVQFCTFFEKGTDPALWPAEINVPLFQAFIAGYDSVNILSSAELESVPHLMIEAIITEPVLAAQRARNISELDPYIPWLEMARRKSSWIQDHVDSTLEHL